MPANTPGGDRPAPRRKPAQYSRTAVAHVTSAGDWHGWEQMLDIPFGTDTDGLWRALNQARQAHG